MPGEPLAAEVYICQEQAVRQAKLHGNSIFEEFSLLLAHGLIHAIGIDHENSETEKNLTLTLEKELLNLWEYTLHHLRLMDKKEEPELTPTNETNKSLFSALLGNLFSKRKLCEKNFLISLRRTQREITNDQGQMMLGVVRMLGLDASKVKSL